jgi:hypothetical protein
MRSFMLKVGAGEETIVNGVNGREGGFQERDGDLVVIFIDGV